MAIVTVGIDLAKNVFALHGVDEAGAARLKQPKVARGKLNALVAALPPCRIGIEVDSDTLLVRSCCLTKECYPLRVCRFFGSLLKV
jgi:hypothetical protein